VATTGEPRHGARSCASICRFADAESASLFECALLRVAAVRATSRPVQVYFTIRTVGTKSAKSSTSTWYPAQPMHYEFAPSRPWRIHARGWRRPQRMPMRNLDMLQRPAEDLSRDFPIERRLPAIREPASHHDGDRATQFGVTRWIAGGGHGLRNIALPPCAAARQGRAVQPSRGNQTVTGFTSSNRGGCGAA
jgi:hypothetical protein